MDWFKKHSDAVMVMTTIIGGTLGIMVWLSAQFGNLRSEMYSEFNNVHKDISELRTEMAIMKTVMLMNKMMPTELAQSKEINSAL